MLDAKPRQLEKLNCAKSRLNDRHWRGQHQHLSRKMAIHRILDKSSTPIRLVAVRRTGYPMESLAVMPTRCLMRWSDKRRPDFKPRCHRLLHLPQSSVKAHHRICRRLWLERHRCSRLGQTWLQAHRGRLLWCKIHQCLFPWLTTCPLEGASKVIHQVHRECRIRRLTCRTALLLIDRRWLQPHA